MVTHMVLFQSHRKKQRGYSYMEIVVVVVTTTAAAAVAVSPVLGKRMTLVQGSRTYKLAVT